MRLTKEQNETENPLLDNRQLRDKCVGRYEVLEQVKTLLLLPDNETATVKQIAEYYSSIRTDEEKALGKKDIIISEDAIQKIYQRNKEEFSNDGVMVKKSKDFLNWTKCPSQRGSITMQFDNGKILTISNAGIKVFPKRAILRIGMLLTGSEVSSEIRSQLLNIEEKTSTEIKTEDIKEEQKLMLSVGMAVASGDANAVAIASANLVAFKNRHIEKLQNDNKALAGEILSWSDRKKLNAGVRQLAAVTGIPFGNMWNELYKNLQYKYGICLKQRGGKPFIQWVDESEWENVIKTFCAMCEAYDQSPTEMFQQTTPEIKPKGIRDLEKLRAKRISK